jgi:hypothetical protein
MSDSIPPPTPPLFSTLFSKLSNPSSIDNIQLFPLLEEKTLSFHSLCFRYVNSSLDKVDCPQDSTNDHLWFDILYERPVDLKSLRSKVTPIIDQLSISDLYQSCTIDIAKLHLGKHNIPISYNALNIFLSLVIYCITLVETKKCESLLLSNPEKKEILEGYLKVLEEGDNYHARTMEFLPREPSHILLHCHVLFCLHPESKQKYYVGHVFSYVRREPSITSGLKLLLVQGVRKSVFLYNSRVPSDVGVRLMCCAWQFGKRLRVDRMICRQPYPNMAVMLHQRLHFSRHESLFKPLEYKPSQSHYCSDLGVSFPMGRFLDYKDEHNPRVIDVPSEYSHDYMKPEEWKSSSVCFVYSHQPAYLTVPSFSQTTDQDSNDEPIKEEEGINNKKKQKKDP